MKIRYILQNALTGLVIGWLVTVGFSYVWQIVFPVKERSSITYHQYLVSYRRSAQGGRLADDSKEGTQKP
jgi:hypothetical protein